MRWLLTMLLCFCMTATALEPNLLTNGSLEGDADGDGVADNWVAEVHQHEGGKGVFALDGKTKVQGAFSQCITHISEKGWVRVSQIGIPAKPNAHYLFRCFVKADCRFLLIVYAFKADGNYDTFVMTEGRGTGDEWQLFSDVVRTPPDAQSFKVSLITDSKGTAWFDDAELILLERPPYALALTAQAPPQLDGDLSDECWQQAEPLMPFLELGTGKITEPITTAKVVATPTHLFIAFHCAEPMPQAMRLKTPESGEPAYMDDCVEVYLDPPHKHDGFWQFVVTPKGNRFAQQVSSAPWAQVWWLLPRPTQQILDGKWQAATKIGDKFWTAEISIPFASLSVQPKTVSVWGINLCRSRKAGRGEKNSAFVYLAEKSFQHPERFPHLVFGDRGIGIRDYGRSIPQSLTIDPSSLVPKPQRIVLHRKPPVVIDRSTQIALPDGATELERTAVELLNDTLKRVGGFPLSVTSRMGHSPSHIVVTTFDRLPAELRPHLPMDKLSTFFVQRGEEAYVIFVGMPLATQPNTLHSAPRTVVLVGASPRGVFNGAQTLRQLIWANCRSPLPTANPRSQIPHYLPSCEIWDYPDLRLRGWHFVAPLRHELPFAEELLEWLALMKFNTLVIEVDDRFPYERHPDIAHPQALTKEEWRHLLDKAWQLGFDVIPQVQTFGHFGYVLNKTAYRHLSESHEPHPRWGFYAYCPSNPETYRLVFDLFDEVLEVFKPKWFHIGHDEITFVPIGVCGRCKGKPAWQLLADEIRRLYDYLKGKGVERVAMWCDQLEPDRTGGYAPYFTHFAADLIPKDIVPFCWHYNARQTFPWLTRLRDKGFDVVACGWYHAQNVWRFSAESFDRRTLGYCGTTWYGVTGFTTQVDLMTAIVLAAENAWSVDIPTIDRANHPTNIAQDLWALVGERERWASAIHSFECVDLTPFVNAPLFGATGIVPDRCPALWVGDEMPTLPCGNGVPFRLMTDLQVVALASDTTPHEVAPDLVAVPMGTKVRALYLLMTTTARPVRTEDIYGRGQTDPKKVATLVVRYADGTEVRQDLRYRQHLTEWNDRLGCSQARIVWQGKTERGYLVTLCAYEWRNLKPDVSIAAVIVQSAMPPVQPVLVALTVGN